MSIIGAQNEEKESELKVDDTTTTLKSGEKLPPKKLKSTSVDILSTIPTKYKKKDTEFYVGELTQNLRIKVDDKWEKFTLKSFQSR